MSDSDSLSKRNIYILLILAICAELFAIVFFVLLSTLGFIGFDGGNPITATSCSTPNNNSYLSTKYSQINLIVQMVYVFSIICLVFCSGVLAIMVKCLLNARDIGEAEFFIPKGTKVTLYVMTSLAVMAAVPCFGYYLSVVSEINNCTATYDNTRLPVLVAFAAALLAALLLIFILLFVFLYKGSEEKYREVQSYPSQPNDTKVQKAQEVKYFNKKHIEREEPYKKQPEIYEKRTPQELEKISPPKRVPNRNEELQHTKEQLYTSPPRQPAYTTYSKEVDPQPLLRPTPERRYEPSSIVQPKSYNKQPLPSESPQKYSSPPRKENYGELMFHKPIGRGNDEDDEDFKQQQSRYLNKYDGRPILAGGMKGQNPGAFTRGELPKKVTNYASPSKVSREGNLVNYIRGKYAG